MIPILGEKRAEKGASQIITLGKMVFTDWGRQEIARLDKGFKRSLRLSALTSMLTLGGLLVGLPPSAYVGTNNTRTYLAKGNYGDMTGVGAFKIALFLVASNLAATSDLYSNLTNELSPTGTGYTTGGTAITLTLSGTTTVTATYSGSPVWTSGATPIVCRYAVIYKVTGSYILCYSTLDSTPADITIATGNTLTINPNASGVFTIA